MPRKHKPRPKGSTRLPRQATAPSPRLLTAQQTTPQAPVTHAAPNIASSVLDPTAHPHIVDLIVSYLDQASQWRLWGVNSALQGHLNAHFYRHIVLRCNGWGSPVCDPFPLGVNGPVVAAFLGMFDNAAEHCRTLDLPSLCRVDQAVGFLPFPKHDVTMRTWNTADLKKAEKLPATLILKCYCIPPGLRDAFGNWDCAYSLTPPGARDGPRRLVFNVSYLWADQVFGSILGFDALPKSVTELVIHFKKIDGERPRYLLCRGTHVTNDHECDHECVAPLVTTSPIPILKPGEHIDLVYPPTAYDGRSLFVRVADVFADAVGRGKARANKKSRALKLTLVGLDEFDRARDLDEAGDDAFAAILPLLPLVDQDVERADWAHPVYHSIADTFVNSVLQRVHKTKHDQVKRSIEIMSSSDYFEQLAPQRRKEEEDWWCAVGEASC